MGPRSDPEGCRNSETCRNSRTSSESRRNEANNSAMSSETNAPDTSLVQCVGGPFDGQTLGAEPSRPWISEDVAGVRHIYRPVIDDAGRIVLQWRGPRHEVEVEIQVKWQLLSQHSTGVAVEFDPDAHAYRFTTGDSDDAIVVPAAKPRADELHAIDPIRVAIGIVSEFDVRRRCRART